MTSPDANPFPIFFIHLWLRQFRIETRHIEIARATERRALHGGFGVGPGQKKWAFVVDSTPSSPFSACPEEAAAESLNVSFGAGSYARRILERMGWRQEAGGRTCFSVKGLTEPLQPVGNKGSAGLGWDHGRSKHP